MQANRSRNTAPELALRRAVHAAGLRYRLNSPVALAGGRRVRPDIVFRRGRVCVFVDGCFWHGCPNHCRIPASNRDYWEAKLARNRERDVRVTSELEASGWTVLRFWEHDDAARAAARVVETVRQARSDAS